MMVMIPVLKVTLSHVHKHKTFDVTLHKSIYFVAMSSPGAAWQMGKHYPKVQCSRMSAELSIFVTKQK